MSRAAIPPASRARAWALACLLPAAAGAQTVPAEAPPPGAVAPSETSAALPAPEPHRGAVRPLWELGGGLGLVRLPHYRGSDEAHDWVLPVPYVVYRGRIFRASRDGARAVLLESDRVDFDLSLSATAPLKSQDSRARRGMADLPGTLELGPNLNLTLAQAPAWKLDLRVPLRGGFTLEREPRAIGWTASPVLNLDVQWLGWNLGAQGGPVYGSRRFHGFFYDVGAADANAQRPGFEARSGFGGWRWALSASRRSGRLWVGAFVRGDDVGGAVFEDSPLVRERRNLSVGLAAAWVFAVSDTRVSHDD